MMMLMLMNRESDPVLHSAAQVQRGPQTLRCKRRYGTIRCGARRPLGARSKCPD